MSQRSRFPAPRHLALLTLALLLMALAATVPAKPPGGGDPPPPPNLPTYTIQSLGTLGGATSTAEGVNDFGDVVGNADQSDGTSAAYLYTAAHGMERIDDITEGPLQVPGRTLFGPDGRFYVLNVGTFLETGSVAVFDPVTGDYIEEFVSPGSGGLDRPAHMVFGPDGNLYIPSFSGEGSERNRVARYDGATGAYMGDFVPYGYGGLDGTAGMTFGPDMDGDGDPDLFVGSSRTNEVLVYSSVDGLFLGDFVESGSGGLDKPGSLLFHDLDGDEVPELLVVSRQRLAVLAYDGLTGDFWEELVSTAALEQYLTATQDIERGPDGDLYITGMHHISTINGTDPQAQVLRCDGQTGGSLQVFIPPNTGGWSSASPRMTFDAQGDVLVNSGNTNQILRFEGPNSSNPGAPLDVFIEGVGFLTITARDINNAGQIVGVGHPLGRRDLFGERAAYRYTPPAPGDLVGRVDDLGVPGRNYEEEATAINNDGDVAGHFTSDATGKVHAFLWTPEDGVIDLGTLAGGDTYVTAINDRVGGDLQVAGYAQTSGGYRAWRYNTATGTMQNLGLISGSSGYSYGYDMNNLGAVTGLGTSGSKLRGFVFASSMSDVGTLGGNNSYAYGINDFGDVVGTADDNTRASKNKHQAFVKTSSTGIYKLEPQITNLPGSLTLKIQPRKINNAGQIIGPGDVGNPNVAYIITPN